jgi:hypothetical protein
VTAEVLSFPPFTVRVRYDLDHLRTHITLSRAKNPDIVVNALAVEFAADTTTGQFFLHTGNSDHPDAATVYSISFEAGQILWRVSGVPPGGPIILNPRERFLDAGKPYGTDDPFIVRITYAGEVLQRNPRSGYEMVTLAEADLAAGHDAAATGLLRRALAADISPNTKATVLQYLGEIVDKAGDSASAIDMYEKALAINPKVGVKKRLARLKGRPVSVQQTGSPPTHNPEKGGA